jgi:phosphatidyl-myo-inositol dimannoside synthase
VKLAILSSTPLNPVEGSGTFVGIRALAGGLERLGHEVRIRPLRFRSGFHTLDRYLYNLGVLRTPPTDVDLVIGVDLDGFLWSWGRSVPLVVSLKGIIADELRNERGWVRVLLRVQAGWERQNCARADLVVVTSEYQAAVARTEYGVDRGRLAVVPEGIDLGAWRTGLAGAARRSRTGLVVLSVARMYPRKRLEDLLEAAAILRYRPPELRVRIVGSGPEWARLCARHRDLGLADTVAMVGDVSPEQLLEEYANADIFCLPSVQEGFGIVFLEAMAAQLPIVACRAAAVPEVVRDGETGLLVAPRTPGALAGALRVLIEHPERARALGAAGARRCARFDLIQVAKTFLEAVESHIGLAAGACR